MKMFNCHKNIRKKSKHNPISIYIISTFGPFFLDVEHKNLSFYFLIYFIDYTITVVASPPFRTLFKIEWPLLTKLTN